MRLVFLYGPPGVGKLSVANELVVLTGFKLLHNHMTVNPVASVFGWRSEASMRVLIHIREVMLVEAAHEGIDLVFTEIGPYPNVWHTADPFEPVRRWRDVVQAGGGSVMFVKLTCARDELLKRVQSESRRAHGKLTDPVILADQLDSYDLFAALPFEPTLQVDSTGMSARDVAEQVVAHYALPLVAGSGVEGRVPAEGGAIGAS